ncbi:pyrethroid hydrolase Ces2a-like [Haliotis asinina]|uniref:pyrethroid hydrolase Ces2a-like n=1 Tax=Haliotis asinina TaxID=109174 RepID=UPI003531DC80
MASVVELSSISDTELLETQGKDSFRTTKSGNLLSQGKLSSGPPGKEGLDAINIKAFGEAAFGDIQKSYGFLQYAQIGSGLVISDHTKLKVLVYSLKMCSFWTVFIGVSCLATTVITFEAEEFVVRETLYGRIRGTVKTVLGSKKVERYLSVPYATSPVGELRFENPEKPTTWRGIRNTTVLPPACPQMALKWSYVYSHRPGFNDSDEDCLYMNLYVPQVAENDVKMAVLVHVHGGSNLAGMGAMLDMDILAAHGEIIVINFNYRLGALGFLSGGQPEFPGNYGLLDQTAALQWVSQNIHFFGGDPNKVTVEGHSAAAADVGYHIVSPLSKGLFRFAIIQSGSPTALWALQSQHQKVLTRYSEVVGCNSSMELQKLKQCLKSVPWRDITDRLFISKCVPSDVCLSPVIDGFFVEKHADILFKEAELNGEAFMAGITRDEVSISVIVHEYFPWDDPLNRTALALAFDEFWGDHELVVPTLDVATRLAARTDNVYFYSFDYASPSAKVQAVPHGRDLFYLFGCPFSGHPLYNYTEEDRQVSKVFMNMWTSFVKTGKPSSTVEKDPVYFQRFDSEIQPYMKIDVVGGKGAIKTAYKPRARQMAFWNNVLPQVITLQSNTTQTEKEKYGILTWSLAIVSGILFLCVCASVVFLMRKHRHHSQAK